MAWYGERGSRRGILTRSASRSGAGRARAVVVGSRQMAVSVEESARNLRARAHRCRAERERRAARIRQAVVRQVRPLLPRGARAWLIGSIAWGGFGERSDIDLVLRGVGGSEATRIEDAVARATGLEVDVLDFEALPSAFQARVTSEGLSIDGG